MQLNARLEGIRSMVVTEAWNKEQLAILFREEIEQASRELEGFAVAARRVGSPSEDQLKADEDVGWAYRLFAVFGASSMLDASPCSPVSANIASGCRRAVNRFAQTAISGLD
ncbi:hypothetical protein H9Q09_17615 [Aurantimonas sp. DM33-3]|nr:hypothetical protein [Aurantimonas sp. DM33-3]MBC6718006.1 hypothetical protein [Aurantimonas sp. DM33-3]